MAARCLRRLAFPRRRPLPHTGQAGSGPGRGARSCSGNVAVEKKSPNLEVIQGGISLPRKKTWDKVAVLQALASTVNRDPTAPNYVFQDDPYLIPRTSTEYRLFSLSKESGKNAARYIIDRHPKLFEIDIAEPHIPCLMPEQLQTQFEEVGEDALKYQIHLRKLKASVDMYDQLMQAGTSVSLETSNSLLDLLCFYGDREPDQQNSAEDSKLEQLEEPPEEGKKRRNWQNGRLGVKWRENNNAERIFNLMPEKNAHSYCAMIRGMVKHRAAAKAFDMYTELLNNRLKADVHTFNALIVAASEVREKYTERWELVEDLLNQMDQQKVQPNLLTFNSVLKTLRWCGSLGKGLALRTLNEMKALNIEPSLATFDHLLAIFHKPAASSRGETDLIYEVLDEIKGKSFYPQDPDDGNFFPNAMRICSLDLKDIHLAYELHGVLETGENMKMLADMNLRTSYCGRFFNLLCMMEQLDVVLKWYKDLVPSMFYPSSQGMLGLLYALDTANHLEMIPQIWKDIKQLGHGRRSVVVEEVLTLMARDSQPPETRVAFADCAADIKSIYEAQDRRQMPLEWTATSLGNCTVLFARAGQAQEAWNMLELFKKHNRIPSDLVMSEVLDCIKQSKEPSQALDLVRFAADLSLQSTSKLAKRALEEFQLSEEQRKTLADMTAESSDSSDGE